jgi:hypothetical protein
MACGLHGMTTMPQRTGTGPENMQDIYAHIESIDRAVVENARHFSIHTEQFDSFLERLPALPETDTLPESLHLFDHGNHERTLNYFFMLESVNFGGVFSENLRAEGFHEQDMDLYQSVALRLKNWFAENGALPAQDMAALKQGDLCAMLGMDASRPISGSIAAMFTESIRETGAFALKHYGGSFTAFLQGANGSAENFVTTLWKLPKFRDVNPYKLRSGKQINVIILKRAQHIAASLQLACQRIGFGRPFADFDKITAFPDNRLSHALMVDGLLEPTPMVRALMRSGEAVPSGSDIETENRICGRHIVRLLSRHSGIAQVSLDYRIWENSFKTALWSGESYDATPQLLISKPSFNY